MRPGRPAAILALSFLLLVLFVHYGAVADRYDASPSTAELTGDYDAYVGDHVYRWGRVVEVRSTAILVRSGPLTFVVEDRPDGVAVGDAVQVDGRLAPDRRIVPDRIVVSDRDALLAMYLVSAVGLGLTARVFVGGWTVDRRRLAIVRRDEDG